MHVSLVRFSREDLEIFSIASGDRNPLHLSAEYAGRTAYGQQVVFGAMGCLACLSAVREADVSVSRVVADFHRPMFLDVNYRLESTATGGKTIVKLLDGSVPVLTTSVLLGPSRAVTAEPPRRVLPAHCAEPWMPLEAVFPLSKPRVFSWDDLYAGQALEGEYRADPAGLQALYRRWSLGVRPMVVEALLWSSYFVGMEMPGQNALFFRVALDFTDEHGSRALPALTEEPEVPPTLRFKAAISNLNRSIAQARINVALHSDGKPVGSGQITSFVRPELPALRLLPDQPVSCDTFDGKVAVVIGASRGLGAALAMTLAADGAQVVAIARSAATWMTDLPLAIRDRITFWESDARDADRVSELAREIGERYGRVDFLICSAFPAIPSLRLEPNAAARIQEYLARATELVLIPLCGLLPQLALSRGCAMLISSAAVEHPVREWPHYVAAKAAAEALLQIAPLQYPETSGIIVRPERLLTEMTNTPMGRKGATSPLVLARHIMNHLRTPPQAGRCQVLDLEQSAEAEARDLGLDREMVAG